MAVELLMNPDTLTWDDFLEKDQVLDPDTGAKVSARTAFEWDWPDKPKVTKDGQMAFADNTLMITPDCEVWKDSGALKDKKKGDALLSHEQFHYDVAHVIGRVVVRKLEVLRAKDASALDSAAWLVFQQHFIVRSRLIHRRYDLETKHGTNAHYQNAWKKLMKQTLDNANATQIGGWWL
jgi:hypothetical protein